MTVQHNVLTDTEGLHEPKGHLTAALGTAYVSDGAASGTWVKVQRSQAACLKATAAGATTGVTNAYQALNDATLGGTIAWTQNTAAEMTTNTTSGYVTIPDAGIYHVTFIGNLIPATNGSVFKFTIGKDSGAGIVSQEAFVETVVTTSGTVDSNLVALSCLPSFNLSDKVYIMVKETTAGEEFVLQNANFIITRIG